MKRILILAHTLPCKDSLLIDEVANKRVTTLFVRGTNLLVDNQVQSHKRIFIADTQSQILYV